MMRYIIILIFIVSVGCNNSNSKTEGLKDFFSKDWSKFNEESLSENDLNTFLKDSIDFFNRESFFYFMKNSNYNNEYQNFLFIEVVELGEVNSSKKVIILNNKGKQSYLAFEKILKEWKVYSLSPKEKANYNSKKLKIGKISDKNKYMIVTNVNVSG